MTNLLARIPWQNWKPRLLDSLATYSKKLFLSDLIAGLTVGLVALPLAMAFGIASGVTPQAGIYTAIIGGFLVSLLGGSKIQIGGPTGAFVVIVAGIIAKHGLSGLLIVTMMAGVILLFLGLTGLGNAVKFIPRPIVIGFTNGIALLIASTQIKDFFGLKVGEVPSEFLARLKTLRGVLPYVGRNDGGACGHVTRRDPAGSEVLPQAPGINRSPCAGHGRGDGVRSASCNDRLQVRWNSRGAPSI